MMVPRCPSKPGVVRWFKGTMVRVKQKMPALPLRADKLSGHPDVFEVLLGD